MDAAHLSQTLYLVATELGLGAFVYRGDQRVEHRGAPRYRRLDRRRPGRQRLRAGRSAKRSPLEPEFAPYVPAVYLAALTPGRHHPAACGRGERSW